MSGVLPAITEAVTANAVSEDRRLPIPAAAPQMAVVLDDCGGNMKLARRFLSIEAPLTWAILPNLRYSADTAVLLEEAGVPYLIHVPMQAIIDAPGRAGRKGHYLIGSGMDYGEVRDALIPPLDSLSGAFGINNHRGSAATSDRSVMDSVMRVLAERKLFFFDSRTSALSVAYDAALERGLDAAYNSRFLDNEPDRYKIAAQMKAALKTARRGGMTAVICHMRPETAAFLESFAGEMDGAVHRESGVKFITLAEWPEYAKGEVR